MLVIKMSLDKQISSISRSVHMYIRKIKQIRTVRLDYCNSLYYGLTQKSTRKLELAQNVATRLIARISIRDPITNVLRELPWLPVSKRCQYKLLY